MFNDSAIAPPTNAVAEKPIKKDTIQRPNNYYVELFTDQLFSQIDFTNMSYSYQPFAGGGSPVYLNMGFNIFLGTTLKDLMEDYKVDLGVKLNTSLTNNEYMLRFSDLSKRIDKSLTLHRYVTDDYSYYYYRTITNEAFFNRALRFWFFLCSFRFSRSASFFRRILASSSSEQGFTVRTPNTPTLSSAALIRILPFSIPCS